nr:hypothetical protein [uncultured Campylobacter sp.]
MIEILRRTRPWRDLQNSKDAIRRGKFKSKFYFLVSLFSSKRTNFDKF